MIPHINPSKPLPLMISWAGGYIMNPSYEQAVKIEKYLRKTQQDSGVRLLSCEEIMELDL
jgi:hypothetical protein